MTGDHVSFLAASLGVEGPCTTARRSLEIVVCWGPTVLDVRHLQPTRRTAVFTIGSGLDVDCVVPDGLLDLEPHPVAAIAPGAMPGRESATIALPPTATVRRWHAGRVEDIDRDQLRQCPGRPGCHMLRLAPGETVRVELGPLAFLFALREVGDMSSWSAVARRRSRPLPRFLATSAVAHAVFFALVWSAPVDAGALSLDDHRPADNWIIFTVIPPRAIEARVESQGLAAEEDGPPVGASGHESAAVNPPAPRRRPRPASPTTSRPAPSITGREAARVLARSVLGHDGGLFGGGATAIGADARAHFDGIDGGSATAHNGSGFGPSAAVPVPGGGDSLVTGVGARDLIARPGRGPKTRVPEKKNTEPQVVPGPLEVRGGLAREEIQRVVRMHRAEYKFCYDRALQSRPDLEGKVDVRFTIGGSGAVIAARITGSTLAANDVEACLLKKMRRWVFPPPVAGTLVEVRYPFMFRAR